VGDGSVVRQRILGKRIRRLRESARVSLGEAARRLEISTSALSRFETGQQAPNVHLMKSMLDEYGVGGDGWEEYLELTREARQKGWWRNYGIGEQDFYIGFETEASRVQDYTVDYVPGLLQTRSHARALFDSSFIERSPAALENALTVRMIRQRRLTSADDPLELVAIIDESVLHRDIGGPATTAEQLAHLVAAAQLPTVTLQVLPSAVTRRAVMGSGLTVLSFDGLDHPDIAYVEHALGALTVEKEADVDRARLMFDRLRSDALSPDDSLALIRQVAERS
jgi:transcriptional regulator with XRE-family HTH domain